MAVLSKAYRLPVLLAGLCCVTAVLLAGQWFMVAAKKDDVKQGLNQPISTEMTLPDLPEDNLQLETQEKFEEIISRPLFVETRQPLPESAADGEIVEDAVEQPKTDLSAKFSGYINMPGGKVALIKDIKTRKYHRISQGEQVNDWTLIELHPDRVIFKQGEAFEELLLRVPKQKSRANQTGMPRRVMRPATTPQTTPRAKTNMGRPPTTRNRPNTNASARRQQLSKRINRSRKKQ